MERKIALFDMDDTLCDYRGKLTRDLSESLGKEAIADIDLFHERIPLKIREAIKEIRQQEGWWRTLPFLSSGMGLWQYLSSLGLENHIASNGPYQDTNGWKEKFEWQKLFLPEAKNITITLDKSCIRGDVLVDDWPAYVKKWLDMNKKSVAILPIQTYNNDFKHPRAIHYDGKNFGELEKFLVKHKVI